MEAAKELAVITPRVDEGKGRVWRVEVVRPGDAAWAVRLIGETVLPLAAGERAVVSFELRKVAESAQDSDGGRGRGPERLARAEEGGIRTNSAAANVGILADSATPETGILADSATLADCRVMLERRDDGSFGKALDFNVRAGREWTRMELGFEAACEVPAGGWLSLCFGHQAQTVEVANVSLVNLGRDYPLNKLPRPVNTYAGREPDAAWRAAALARIERIRKQDFDVTLRGADGQPLRNQDVSLELYRHDFGFGAAVSARLLQDKSQAGILVRNLVSNRFSRVTLENDLKPYGVHASREGRITWIRPVWTQKAFAWCEKADLPVRGHYLAQSMLDEWTKDFKRDPTNLTARMLGHIRTITGETQGKVLEWDAINHLGGWRQDTSNLGTLVGEGLFADLFRAARAATPAPLWVTDDKVFEPGLQSATFRRRVEALIAAGLKPDGLGLQAHLYGSRLPSPERVLAALDEWSTLVPRLQITEFSLQTNGDEALKADYTRDLLVAAFSHPACEGLTLWTWWAGTRYKPQTALWNEDGTPLPAGKVWEDWVNGAWTTRVQGRTDAEGRIRFRGFRGLYRVRTGEGEHTVHLGLVGEERKVESQS